jgi:glutamine synthetase
MLTDIVEQVERGAPQRTLKGGALDLGARALPQIPRHSGDRNRTSPFAFTGDKFEFRAVGSSATSAWPNSVMNTIVADSIQHLAAELEKAAGPRPGSAKLQAAVRTVLKGVIKRHKRIIFNGDGYSKRWHLEAKRRGLPVLTDSVQAIPVLGSAKAVKLFGRHKVLNKAEVQSRVESLLEKYTQQLAIESEVMVMMARQFILPAATKQQTLLAQAVGSCREAGVDCGETLAALEEFAALLSRFNIALVRLEKAAGRRNGSLAQQARRFKRTVRPRMAELRTLGDELETRVAAEFWPLASYRELLFTK